MHWLPQQAPPQVVSLHGLLESLPASAGAASVSAPSPGIAIASLASVPDSSMLVASTSSVASFWAASIPGVV